MIVTHNMQQAARVAEITGFFLMGKLIEFDTTQKIFTNPATSGRKITSQAGSDDAHPISSGTGRSEGASLLLMGGLAEQAIQRAIEAYIARATSRICDLVLEGEMPINTLEREIDQMALDLLAMEQPMAIDLRFILAVIKINADLERVGDQAVNIAERVLDMVELPKADLPVDIPRMAAAVSAMVRRALQSFIEGNAEVARAVLEMDNVVDRMKDEAFITLVKTMNENPAVTRAGAECAADCAQPGARGRPCHQYRRRRHLLGARRRRAPQSGSGRCARRAGRYRAALSGVAGVTKYFSLRPRDRCRLIGHADGCCQDTPRNPVVALPASVHPARPIPSAFGNQRDTVFSFVLIHPESLHRRLHRSVVYLHGLRFVTLISTPHGCFMEGSRAVMKFSEFILAEAGTRQYCADPMIWPQWSCIASLRHRFPAYDLQKTLPPSTTTYSGLHFRKITPS